MNRNEASWQKHCRPGRRRLIQLYAALLYNANLKGFIRGEIYTGKLKSMCVPGLNCYSCPGAVGACPLGSLQNALNATGQRAPFYVLGILMLFGLIAGRTICGWFCPVGLVQELLHKIPTPKVKKGRITRGLSRMRIAILVFFVVAIPLLYAGTGLSLPAFCKYICPAGTGEGSVSLLAHPGNGGLFAMLGSLFSWKFTLLVAIALACIFVYRAFCRFLCPLGLIYGFFSRLNILGVKVDAGRCTQCGQCVGFCKMDVRHVGDHECIHCGECIPQCKAKAISFRCGKIVLMDGEAPAKPKPVLWKRLLPAGAALLLLAAVIVFTQWETKSEAVQTATPVTQTAVQEGNRVGMRCPDFELPLYGEKGERFRLSDQVGKVVVLNFWGTTCTPCIEELPFFQRLADGYGDAVAVLAVHTEPIADEEEIAAFRKETGLGLPMAIDAEDTVFAMLGGRSVLPMTVILDRTGVIRFHRTGKLDGTALEETIRPLLAP